MAAIETTTALKIVATGAHLPITAIFISMGLSPVVWAILGTLVLLDVFTGTIKQIRIGGRVTSRRFIIGLFSKIVTAGIVPLALGLTGKALTILSGIDMNVGSFISVAFGLLILSEFYSIIGNVVSIKTGEKVEEFDAVTTILSKTRVIINNIWKGALHE